MTNDESLPLTTTNDLPARDIMTDNRLITPNIKIRHEIRPGDIGYVLYLHGLLYAEEYGLDHTFEADVAASLSEFYSTFEPSQDRLWLAENNGQITGTIAIVGRSELEAQLRWYLIHPTNRGLGLGKALLDEAIMFSVRSENTGLFIPELSVN